MNTKSRRVISPKIERNRFMTTKLQDVGHKTLRVADIAPQKSLSFSPNLHKYAKAHGHFFTDGGILQGVFMATDGTKAAEWFGAGTLVLGHMDDGFFMGARLMEVLCKGSKAQSAAHACASGFVPVVGFWDAYLSVGRCAIDPAHSESFLDDRYRMEGETRICVWCGAKHERVMTPRTVFDESWLPLKS